MMIFGAGFYYFFDLFYDYYKFHLVSVPDMQQIYGKKSYVLITGATSPLGLEFAETFAKQGFNLILVSNNETRLEAVSELIGKTYRVNALPLKMDFSRSIEHELKILSSQSKTLDISIVVSNPGPVHNIRSGDLTYDQMTDVVTINSANPSKLIYSLIPRLSQRPNRSAIINVSSILALRPFPYLSLYSATHAYNHFMSVALAEELDSKIDIISCLPTLNHSKDSTTSSSSWFLVSPHEAVTECLKDLGFKKLTYGHYKSTLAAYLLELLPESLRFSIIEKKIQGNIDALTDKEDW